MKNIIKYKIVVLSYISVYINFQNSGFIFGIEYNPLDQYDTIFFMFYSFCLIYILIMLVKANYISMFIFIKIIIFTLFLIVYFFIEQALFTLSMYSIGGTGGFTRNNIYEQFDHMLQWYEVLFWNFIFSLHYPAYIFIFLKPFVNHLDKSIKSSRNYR